MAATAAEGLRVTADESRASGADRADGLGRAPTLASSTPADDQSSAPAPTTGTGDRHQSAAEVAAGAQLSDSPQATVRVVTFAEFYEQNRTRLVAVAYGLSGSRWAAEELAHDAFLAALRRWDEVASYDEPAAWITRVVVNRAASRWRRLVNESRAVARLGAQRRQPLPELEAPDEAFWAAVRSLPRRQAQAVALHYLEDLPVADIAAILDCAEATVRVHLHRGRQTLATKLTEDGETSP